MRLGGDGEGERLCELEKGVKEAVGKKETKGWRVSKF